MMELVYRTEFHAARKLTRVPPDHPCARLHGHTFRVCVRVEGEIDATTGWVMDYGQLHTRVDEVLQTLDHRQLNDIEGLENPTSEHITLYLWQRLKPSLPGLSSVSVAEGNYGECVYRG